MSEGPTPTAGACWFCGTGRAGGDSVVYPFDAQGGDEVRVALVPRCDACMQVHRRQMTPSAVIIGAAAFTPPALVTLLMADSGLRTALSVVGMIAGVAAGIVLVSGRERRAAARHGTRPAYDSLEHEGYKALAADTARWRPRGGDGMKPDSSSVSPRLETVDDYRLHFRHDARALDALERACRDAGLGPRT
jgi:hypothetical protein